MARTCDGDVGISIGMTLFSMSRDKGALAALIFLRMLGFGCQRLGCQGLAAPGDELPDQKWQTYKDRRREVDKDQPPRTNGVAARRLDVTSVEADDEIRDCGDDDQPRPDKPQRRAQSEEHDAHHG